MALARSSSSRPSINTSTANLVFILAFTTMFAALLSWVFLGERPRPRDASRHGRDDFRHPRSSSGDSVGTGNLFGDLMALCSAFLIASAITISRASGEDMGFTALIGVDLPLRGRRLHGVAAAAFRSKRRGGSSSTARSSCRCRSSAWPPARATSPARRLRCSICWKRFWRRSGCGSSSRRRQAATA